MAENEQPPKPAPVIVREDPETMERNDVQQPIVSRVVPPDPIRAPQAVVAR